MKFNINEPVILTLTELGLRIIREKYSYIAIGNGNKIQIQMHEAFNIFGEYLVNGLPIPFETEIELITK